MPNNDHNQGDNEDIFDNVLPFEGWEPGILARLVAGRSTSGPARAYTDQF